MKQVQYTDKDGRSVTKKEGFSIPTFLILCLLGLFPGIIYGFSKGIFGASRGLYRVGKRAMKK